MVKTASLLFIIRFCLEYKYYIARFSRLYRQSETAQLGSFAYVNSGCAPCKAKLVAVAGQICYPWIKAEKEP